jgi:hypothetical protein
MNRNELSRSLVTFDQTSTLLSVIELEAGAQWPGRRSSSSDVACGPRRVRSRSHLRAPRAAAVTVALSANADVADRRTSNRNRALHVSP